MNTPVSAAHHGKLYRQWRRIKRDRYLLLMLILPMAFYVIFRYGPMYGILMAFENFKVKKGIWGSSFVGLKHFEKFIMDPNFWRAFRNTIVLGVEKLLFCFPAPVVLALMINEVRNTKMKKFVQSVSYMPYFVSTVVVCSIAISFFSNRGIINQVVSSFGHERVNFFLEPAWFRPLYIITDLWQHVGWSSIIYMAALAGCDMEVYEAAKIDGADRLQQIRYITFPYLLPTISIMLILDVGSLMDVSFEKIFLLQTPSTYEVSDVISTMVYRRGIQNVEFSYSTAVGLFQSVISTIFIVSANAISSKIGETSLF